MMETCADIMTNDPVSCAPGDVVEKAANLMRQNDVGPVPVVDDDKLVGIVTDRDLTLKVLAEGRDPKRTRVQDVMTREVVTCRTDDDVQKALEAMSEHQIRRIPVVDEEDRLVGMIAQADVATNMTDAKKVAGVVKDISQSERSGDGRGRSQTAFRGGQGKSEDGGRNRRSGEGRRSEDSVVKSLRSSLLSESDDESEEAPESHGGVRAASSTEQMEPVSRRRRNTASSGAGRSETTERGSRRSTRNPGGRGARSSAKGARSQGAARRRSARTSGASRSSRGSRSNRVSRGRRR
jgi:CBS domain-containing protein